MFLTLLLVLVLAVITYHYYVRFSWAGRLIDKIPGPVPIPFFGNILSCQVPIERLWYVGRELNSKYYPIFRFWSFSLPVVNLCHPDDVEVLLSSTKNIKKSIIYELLHPWFSTGLLTSAGQKWQHRRKILTPAFHFNVLQQFSDVLVEESERIVDSLRSHNGPVVKDLLPLISEHTLNSICETAMGTSLQDKGTFQHKYRKAVYSTGKILVHRFVRPWLYNDFLFSLTSRGKEQKANLKILHGFTKKIIQERKEYHDQTGGRYLREFREDYKTDADVDQEFSTTKKRLAMLDLLIAAWQDGNQIDENGIREEVDTFMFEGHDTVAMGICFALLLLAEHKEVQDRARAEVEAVMDENVGKVTMATLQRLSYLERCIKESLRLYPSVPFISRVLSQDMQLKKYLVPVGTIVHVHIYELHRDPNFWTDPTTFDPDRFLPERIQGRHPYCYIPFSAGPRNCIGQRFAMLELKAIVAHLLYNFQLEPVDRLSDVKMLADLVLRPGHPIRLKFIPIDRSSQSSQTKL